MLGLAVGGWLVSVLVAGAATADETSGPSHDLPVCSPEAVAGENRASEARSDLADCEAQPAPEDTADSADTADSTDKSDRSPDSTGPLDGPDSADGTDSDQDVVQPDSGLPAPDDDTDSTDTTDTIGLPGDDADRSSGTGPGDLPDEADTTLPGAPSPEMVREPALLDPVRPLLKATTGTLLSTTRDLAHTTGSLTDLLFGALPEVTDPIRDTIEDVVDVPSTLPDVESPVAVLPGFTLPRLPIDVGHLLPAGPGEPSDRPDGEARIEPVASPGKAPEQPPATPRHTAKTDRVTETVDTSHWTAPDSEEGTEARDGRSSRPLGPVAPTPTTPASVAAPSNTAASPQDGSQHLHRGEHGVLDDLPTVTQLRLLGSSRDHDVVGVSREAALPTTSPD